MQNGSIDFAYKYPFTEEAKTVVDSLKIDRIDTNRLSNAEVHIAGAVSNGLEYRETGMRDAKAEYIVTYAFCRMILSAWKNMQLINSYAGAEAARSAVALAKADNSELSKLAGELDMIVKTQGQDFAVSAYQYLNRAPATKGLELVNQRLSGGTVLLPKGGAVKLLLQAVKAKIMEGMPIDAKLLPKEVIDYAKGTGKFISLVSTSTPHPLRGARGSTWIDKLLQTPIPDIRHRTVNLILAPYLVNTKGMDPEQAASIINEYIERCKLLDPGTKINYKYIRYQCEYAKKRGLRPLSLTRAKDLLSGAVDVNTLL